MSTTTSTPLIAAVAYAQSFHLVSAMGRAEWDQHGPQHVHVQISSQRRWPVISVVSVWKEHTFQEGEPPGARRRTAHGPDDMGRGANG